MVWLLVTSFDNPCWKNACSEPRSRTAPLSAIRSISRLFELVDWANMAGWCDPMARTQGQASLTPTPLLLHSVAMVASPCASSKPNAKDIVVIKGRTIAFIVDLNTDQADFFKVSSDAWWDTLDAWTHNECYGCFCSCRCLWLGCCFWFVEERTLITSIASTLWIKQTRNLWCLSLWLRLCVFLLISPWLTFSFAIPFTRTGTFGTFVTGFGLRLWLCLGMWSWAWQTFGILTLPTFSTIFATFGVIFGHGRLWRRFGFRLQWRPNGLVILVLTRFSDYSHYFVHGPLPTSRLGRDRCASGEVCIFSHGNSSKWNELSRKFNVTLELRSTHTRFCG